jgi:predicted TIM-barrel fold metal-dependent hydrolase
MSDLFAQYDVIDVDTHITEPADLWTSRVPKKWIDQAPHIERIGGKDYWVIDGKKGLAPGMVSLAGYDAHPPDGFPPTFDEIAPATYDAKARLAHMDREGIYAQVLYPNVGGFGSQNFLGMSDPALKLACVRAYNDFLTEWASADAKRLLPVTALPFWDVKAAVAEIERCARLGHRSILFPSQPQDFGQPSLHDEHWDAVWSTAQDAALPVSFHIGGQALLGVKVGEDEIVLDPGQMGVSARFTQVSALSFIGNAIGITELICGGVCHRFPKLNFVSVESGAGWIPTLVESLDWQWHNAGVAKEHPEFGMLPSEFFQRQVYGCFWFERDMLPAAARRFPNNFMYETDFPHPTSMSPGPATIAQHPRDYAAEALAGIPSDIAAKLLHDNAARVYHVH